MFAVFKDDLHFAKLTRLTDWQHIAFRSPAVRLCLLSEKVFSGITLRNLTFRWRFPDEYYCQKKFSLRWIARKST